MRFSRIVAAAFGVAILFLISARGYSDPAPALTQVSVNSQVTLFTQIHNAYQHSVNYTVIYQILDSSGFTSMLDQIPGQLASYGNGSATAYWVPDAPGTYEIRAFIINRPDVPELLTQAWTAHADASEDQGGNYTEEITGHGSIGSSVAKSIEPLPTLAQLKDYALSRINQDRASFGMLPLNMSSNPAAQAHANEMLKTQALSLWTSDGMKPYMLFTTTGGQGYVAENVAGGMMGSGTNCSGVADCSLTADDIYRRINASEYGLMYNDGDCCGDLHRNNIVDPFHTDVSIGIAYDNYSLYMVENFENNYISYDKAITTDNRTITVSGTTHSGVLSEVKIYYDDPPTHNTYLGNLDQTSYDPGVFVGGVVADASNYTSGTTITATRWQPTASSIDLSFDMSSIMTHPGVYTIYMFFDDNKSHRFVVSSYSLFHG